MNRSAPGAIVVLGPDEVSKALGKSIASISSLELCEPSYKRFPDGEQYLRLTCDVSRRHVIVVKTFMPDQDSSALFALLAADAAKEANAESVTLVAPYLAYARQDRAFLSGEPVSVRALLRALWAAGYSRLVTVEVHKPDSLKEFPGTAYNVRPYPLMVDSIGLRSSKDLVVLSPDLGALERAKILAEHLGVGYDYLEKLRDRYTGQVSVKPKSLDVNGKHVIIVDDIISTGSTVVTAINELRRAGATGFDVIVAHALLAEGAEERLRSAGVSAIYAANTTPLRGSIVHQINVAPAIVNGLRSLGIIH